MCLVSLCIQVVSLCIRLVLTQHQRDKRDYSATPSAAGATTNEENDGPSKFRRIPTKSDEDAQPSTKPSKIKGQSWALQPRGNNCTRELRFPHISQLIFWWFEHWIFCWKTEKTSFAAWILAVQVATRPIHAPLMPQGLSLTPPSRSSHTASSDLSRFSPRFDWIFPLRCQHTAAMQQQCSSDAAERSPHAALTPPSCSPHAATRS